MVFYIKRDDKGNLIEDCPIEICKIGSSTCKYCQYNIKFVMKPFITEGGAFVHRGFYIECEKLMIHIRHENRHKKLKRILK